MVPHRVNSYAPPVAQPGEDVWAWVGGNDMVVKRKNKHRFQVFVLLVFRYGFPFVSVFCRCFLRPASCVAGVIFFPALFFPLVVVRFGSGL